MCLTPANVPHNDGPRLTTDNIARALLALANDRLGRAANSGTALNGEGAAAEHPENVETVSRTTGEGQSRLEEKIDTLIAKDACLEAASEQLKVLSEQHYDRCVMEPLVGQLAVVLDWAEQAHERWLLSETIPQAEGMEWLGGMVAQVFELLRIYGAEPIAAPPGTPFDPKTMIVADRTCGGEAGRQFVVESTVQIGFRRGNRIFRHQKVRVAQKNWASSSCDFTRPLD